MAKNDWIESAIEHPGALHRWFLRNRAKLKKKLGFDPLTRRGTIKYRAIVKTIKLAKQGKIRVDKRTLKRLYLAWQERLSVSAGVGKSNLFFLPSPPSPAFNSTYLVGQMAQAWLQVPSQYQDNAYAFNKLVFFIKHKVQDIVRQLYINGVLEIPAVLLYHQFCNQCQVPANYVQLIGFDDEVVCRQLSAELNTKYYDRLEAECIARGKYHKLYFLVVRQK